VLRLAGPGVLHEQERGVGRVGELDEVDGLLVLRRGEHVDQVGQHADRIAVQLAPAGDQAGSGGRRELVELAAVQDPRQHLPRVEDAVADHGQQAFGVVPGCGRWEGPRSRPALTPVEPAHTLPGQPQPVALVLGDLVGRGGTTAGYGRGARLRAAAVSAPYRLGVNGRQFGVPTDHDRVIGQGRQIRGVTGGRPEHHTHGGYAVDRQLAQVTHPGAAGRGTGRRGGTGRFDQIDHRQAVRRGDPGGPADLLGGVRVDRATVHRRIVRDDHTLDALDHTDAGDHARADRIVRTPGGDRGQLQERAVLIEQHLHTLARQQLAPGVVPGHPLLAAAGPGLVEGGLQGGQALEHGAAALQICGGTRVDHGVEHGHEVTPTRRPTAPSLLKSPRPLDAVSCLRPSP
jgi:hypothetical protein